jgi:hypothetical protein
MANAGKTWTTKLEPAVGHDANPWHIVKPEHREQISASHGPDGRIGIVIVINGQATYTLADAATAKAFGELLITLASEAPAPAAL